MFATEGNEWKPVWLSVYVPQNELSSMEILPVLAGGDSGSKLVLFNRSAYIICAMHLLVVVFLVC